MKGFRLADLCPTRNGLLYCFDAGKQEKKPLNLANGGPLVQTAVTPSLKKLSSAIVAEKALSTNGEAAHPLKEGSQHISAQTFTFRELAVAMRNFRADRLVGEGGFGRVYKSQRESTGQESLLKEIEQAVGSPLGKGPQAPRSKPLVLVISGPSGVGKDAVINRLKEVRDEIHSVVTATTRARRPGEEDGKDYFFVKREEFEAMIQKDELLEYAVVYGDLKGIPKRQVRDYLSRGVDCILRVDVQGAATIRSIMGSGAVFIFLVAESEEELVKRLVERKTETKEKLLVRIATAREELKRMNEFDYVVVNVNGKLERTVALISHIIDAEKARVHQREPDL